MSESSTTVTTSRDWFDRAATGYLESLDVVERAPLDTIALGAWTLRDLLGHGARAFLTIEQYLETEPGDAPHLASAHEYVLAMVETAQSDETRSAEAVAKRGREAGEALGSDPVAATFEITERVRALVAETGDDAVVTTPWGWMRLGDYLGTRAFELTVHGMDVARATGRDIPDDLAECASDAIALTLEMASSEQRVAALLALTGREPLPHGFSMVP